GQLAGHGLRRVRTGAVGGGARPGTAGGCSGPSRGAPRSRVRRFGAAGGHVPVLVSMPDLDGSSAPIEFEVATVSRRLSSEGLVVGISYAPSLHDAVDSA